MKKVTVSHDKPDLIMTTVREMRKAGLVQGEDFDFAFYNAQYDDTGFNLVNPRHTVFTFYKDKWATWYSIKWSKG